MLNKKILKVFVAVVIFGLISGMVNSSAARPSDDRGPVRFKGQDALTAAGKTTLFMHDVGNVRMTLSNWGEQGNPDGIAGYIGFEFPLGAESDFLFSSGIWVGAKVGGEPLVSTGTDGDNGTNEFAPTFDNYISTSKQYGTLADKEYVKGAKEIDDDNDWDASRDDTNQDGKKSVNYDGVPEVDDDGDLYVDEEMLDGIDNDGDGLIDEDTIDGDANGDGNVNYDPEPHIDEDPAGNMAADFIDNDYDGFVDMADEFPANDPSQWYDGDVDINSDDDDGDGEIDEDGAARGTQEFFCVYDDTDVGEVQNADVDGHTPLNIQVLQRSYAWGEAYAASFILVDLIIRNIGEIPLTDVFIGLFADPDIGARGEGGDPASIDDWNMYDADNLMMVQGDDSLDADGYGPGMFAMKIVRTPGPVDSLSISFRNFDRLAGGDPETNVDKYNMISTAQIDPPTPDLGDWRFLMGFGPRSGGWFPEDDRNLLMPGAELPVTVAFIAGHDLVNLRKNAEWAQRIYDNDFQGPAAPDQPEFWVQPHPDRIRIFWRDNSEYSIDPITKIKDFEGYVIQRSRDLNSWESLVQYDIINRLPDPQFEKDNMNFGMPYDDDPSPGQSWDWDIDNSGDEPDTLGRVYWYDDDAVLRGWTYHYIVRAFDQGVEGAGVLITSIGRFYATIPAVYSDSTMVGAGSGLKDVWVVPNPYKGSHLAEFDGRLGETGLKYYPRKLWFMNLPVTGATINVYTLAGDHVVTIDHPAGNSMFEWDMRNKYSQEIVSGLYLFVAEAGGEVVIDKFVVLK